MRDDADLLALWVIHNALEGLETGYSYRWMGQVLRFQAGKAIQQYIRERRRLGLPCGHRYRELLKMLQSKPYHVEKAPVGFGTSYGLWCEGIDTTAEDFMPRKEAT